eukprot:scaffold1752_cov188-Amphora_coffeaeformis.AAC.2
MYTRKQSCQRKLESVLAVIFELTLLFEERIDGVNANNVDCVNKDFPDYPIVRCSSLGIGTISRVVDEGMNLTPNHHLVLLTRSVEHGSTIPVLQRRIPKETRFAADTSSAIILYYMSYSNLWCYYKEPSVV